jgi:hypothetical protein
MDAYDELKIAFYNLGRFLSKLGIWDWVKVEIERIKKLR